jgi:sugar lactone lactonase YvrE
MNARVVRAGLAAVMLGTIISAAAGSSTSLAADAVSPEVVYGQPDFTSSGGCIERVCVLPATASAFALPFGIAVDASSDVYVADYNNNRVLEFPSSCPAQGCAATRVFGQPDFTSTTPSGLFAPVGVAVDGAGDVYVTDTGNSRVVEYPSTCPAAGCAASRTISINVNSPLGLAVDRAGDVYVSDAGSNHVFEFAPTCPAKGCEPVRTFGSTDPRVFNMPVSASALRNPEGIALDNDGNLYVADTGASRIVEFPSSCAPKDCAAIRVYGQPDYTTGIEGISQCRSELVAPTPSAPPACPPGAELPGVTSSNLTTPSDVTVDSQGKVYVADFGDNRVLEYPSSCPPTGCAATVVYGQALFTSRNDGTSMASLHGPRRLTVDALGNLYIVDQDNNRVLRNIAKGVPVSTDSAQPPANPADDEQSDVGTSDGQ